MSLCELQEMVENRRGWWATVPGDAKSQTGRSDWKTVTNLPDTHICSQQSCKLGLAVPTLQTRGLRFRELITDSTSQCGKQDGNPGSHTKPILPLPSLLETSELTV